MRKKAKKKVLRNQNATLIRINSFEIHFLGEGKRVDEFHRMSYRIKPVTKNINRVFNMIAEDVKRAVNSDCRQIVIEVSTNEGKFFFTKRHLR